MKGQHQQVCLLMLQRPLLSQVIDAASFAGEHAVVQQSELEVHDVLEDEQWVHGGDCLLD